MPEALMLLAALASNGVGLAWLALTMDAHWRQVRGAQRLSRRTRMVLRILGVFALALSLFICLRADHASMAPLVWVMALAAGALLVAFALAWRPRLLAPLIAWIRAG